MYSCITDLLLLFVVLNVCFCTNILASKRILALFLLSSKKLTLHCLVFTKVTVLFHTVQSRVFTLNNQEFVL